MRAFDGPIKNDGDPNAAASNTTAATPTPFTVRHADWIALTKALDSSPDTPPATLALKAQRLAESRTAALKRVNAHDAIRDALRAVIATHCPNDKLFCGACTDARKLLTEPTEAQP